MAGSSDVVANAQALATDYNKLRADVLNNATGHNHEDPDGKRLAKNALRFTAAKLLLGAGGAEPTEIDIPASTKEFFMPVTFGTTMTENNDVPGALINATADKAHIGFFVPADFTAITEAVVMRIAAATATHRLNYTSHYANATEQISAHTEALPDQDTVENVTNLYEQDISGILSNLAVGDYVGIEVLGDVTNVPNDLIAGVRFKYS